MKICVFGASSDNIDKKYFDDARRLGQEMAKRGHTLVFGGGAHGLMGAVARGIHDKNGESVGIAPRFFDIDDVLFKEGTSLIYTESMSERKKMMEDISDAFVAVPGGVGTYEELFEVMTLKQIGQMNKPIVLLNTNNYYGKLEELLIHTLECGFVRADCKDVYKIFSSAEEILEYIENYDEKSVNSLKY
jgi:uncharacterized protein (TIGR00730 family)